MNTEMIAGHDSVEGKKEALVKDIKVIVDDADALMKEVASATADGFALARTRVEGGLVEARTKLENARLDMAKKTMYVAGATNAYVRENPWRILGVAVATGLAVGFLLSRR